MKKYIGLFFVLILCLGVAKAQNTRYTLNVKVSAQGHNLIVIDQDGKVDSLIWVNGCFRMEGEAPVPHKVSLYMVSEGQQLTGNMLKKKFSVYIEPGKIMVTSTTGKLAGSVLSGTPLNNDLYAYDEMRRGYMTKLNKLEIDYTQSQKNKTPIQSNLIVQKYDSLELKLQQEEKAFFQSHLNSLVSLDWLRSYLSASKKKKEVSAMFESMGIDVKQSEAGKKFAAQLANMQVIELNAMAPDFTVKNLKGEDVSLKSYRGKYVLVDFWASWCGPCRKENPNVVAAYNAFKDKNFTILGVSLDNAKEAWAKAIEKDGLEWEQVSDLKGWNSAPAVLYGVRSIPTNFLVNPEGRIIGLKLRGEELQSKLAEILAK